VTLKLLLKLIRTDLILGSHCTHSNSLYLAYHTGHIIPRDHGYIHQLRFGCQLRWAFALLIYLPFGEINIVVVVVSIPSSHVVRPYA